MSKTNSSSVDNTVYKEYTSGPYSLISVEQSDLPALKALYDSIAKNLQSCYQPISLGLAGEQGVCITTPFCTEYIHEIQMDDREVIIKPFGCDEPIHIPKSQEYPELPSAVILTPQLFTANSTSFFSNTNELIIDSTHITAWVEVPYGHVLYIEGEQKAKVQGQLVAYGDYYITVQSDNVYRAYSLVNPEWNEAMNLLPENLNTFWDVKRQEVILAGLNILKKETSLVLTDIYPLENNALWLRVSTLANPDLPFILNLEWRDRRYAISMNGTILARGSTITSKPLWRSL